MSARRFDALVVDFGGVLTTSLQDAMVAFAQSMGIDFQDLVRAALGAYTGGEDSLVTDFETGKIAEEEFSREFARRLEELSGVRVDPENLIARLFNVRLEEDMFAIVARAREHGYKTALLSNSWGSDLYPRGRIDDVCEVVVISGEVGMRKPQPEIFRHTAAQLGVTPERCVFVDDHPGHLQAAEELGMTTVLHRDPARTIAEVEALLDIGTKQ